MSDPIEDVVARWGEATAQTMRDVMGQIAAIGAQIAKTGITLQSRRHSRFTLPTPSRPPCPQSAPPIDARIADMAITTRRHQ